MSDTEKVRKIAIYEGTAKIGEVLKNLANIRLTPEDFSSPIALQMALSRIYNAIIKSFEEGPEKRYVAEVRFKDSLGNIVSFAVDLGSSLPPFSSNEVKARIIVELYEE
ncbi:hypothetical protein J4526_02595 [Desulfurococcaceae archaeon MEX13E-LK6-19]|nr:hypothetical protein J4526_02595 [Desulfurococcaceae archaeon MEX13E-LK6-19]